jgi:triacylglycerol lipase
MPLFRQRKSDIESGGACSHDRLHSQRYDGPVSFIEGITSAARRICKLLIPDTLIRAGWSSMGKHLDQTLAILTGTVGDYLAGTGNGLATPMTLVHAGVPLTLTRAAVAAAYPDATSRAVLLVHGLMATERCFAFAECAPAAEPVDYAALLHRSHGWTPLRLRFNTGAPMVKNGRDLAVLLSEVVRLWPVPLVELALVGHSMGGLAVRAACRLAVAEKLPWLSRVQRIVYLGTPHQGAPLERVGRQATRLLRRVPDPVAQLVGQVADLRSQGIQELGDPTLTLFDPTIRHLLVAGTLAQPTLLQTWLGDGMVSVRSAQAGLHSVALPGHITLRCLPGVSHIGLAHSLEVADLLIEWLGLDAAGSPPEPLPAQPPPPEPPVATAAPAIGTQHLHGLFELTQAAVLHGNRAVQRVRLRRGDQVFAVLQTVPGLGASARVAQVVHDAVVIATHGTVEGVAQAAAELHERGFPQATIGRIVPP